MSLGSLGGGGGGSGAGKSAGAPVTLTRCRSGRHGGQSSTSSLRSNPPSTVEPPFKQRVVGLGEVLVGSFY